MLTASASALHGRDRREPPRGHAEARLRVLSYNIQTGVAGVRYRHYLTRGWRHLAPYPGRWRTFAAIARRLVDFDLVGLQETDAGSFRTGFNSPTDFLARGAGFAFRFDQVNRRVAGLARHSNGLLSRVAPFELHEYALPGPPGRGALLALYGAPARPLAVLVVHLALGRRTRGRQLRYLGTRIAHFRDLIMMGDFNCAPHSRELADLLAETALRAPTIAGGTYPSWAPWRRLDHILVTPTIRVERCYLPDWRFSDHLPIAMELVVPWCIGFGRPMSAGVGMGTDAPDRMPIDRGARPLFSARL